MSITSFQIKMSTIGLIGGTGDLGSALAVHLTKTYRVLLGSRNIDKAKTAVDEIKHDKASNDYIFSNLVAAENSTVVSESEILVLTVPHSNAIETITNLSSVFHGNQVLISAVAAVSKKGADFVADESAPAGSFAETIKGIVPASVSVAAAFQTVPANVLYREKEISADVPITADSLEVYQKVGSVVEGIQGLRPLYLGSLQLSGEIERLTAFLLNIGKRNGLKSPTIRF